MIRLEETLLNEVERHILGTLCDVPDGYGMQMPEGHAADTAASLVRKGFAEETLGYFSITDAGRSQLRSNR